MLIFSVVFIRDPEQGVLREIFGCMSYYLFYYQGGASISFFTFDPDALLYSVYPAG